jgi:acyl-CoA thioesterase-1
MAYLRPNLPVLLCSVLLLFQLSGCSSSSATREDILYLAVGASDALGIGASPLRNGYVYRIRDELEQQTRRNVRLLNLAIPNGTTRELRQALASFGGKALKTDLVTIWTGSNDLIRGQAPQDFEIEFGALLRELRGDNPAFIVVADIPDLTKSPRFRIMPSPTVTMGRIAAFNQVIERQAGALQIPIVRLSREPITDDLVSEIDGFHPSDKGHRQIAQLFLKIILPRFIRD